MARAAGVVYDRPANDDEEDGGAARPRPRRMSAEERVDDFVAEAAEFFAEAGFEGGTRELARRLGVTQPLLYRYFPSKDDLIRAVYRRVFLDRWNPDWDDLLTDRSRPLRDRLEAFYGEYTERIFTPEWIRIYLQAGLRGVDINRWYNRIVEEMILGRAIREWRAETGGDPEAPVSRDDLELLWTIHGGIFYYGIRKYIYRFDVQDDKAAMIRSALDMFFAVAPHRLASRAEAERKLEPEPTAE